MTTSGHSSAAAPEATYKALRITTNQELELVDIPADGELSALQSAVDGFIEILSLAPGLSMVLDEEGKLKNKQRNDVAIRLTQHFGVRLQPGDFIVGDVVLVGVTEDDDGDRESDVPDSVIDVLARLGYPVR